MILLLMPTLNFLPVWFALSLLRFRLPSLLLTSRRRHMICSRDWSSDVCSSDLRPQLPPLVAVLRTSYRAWLAVALAGFFVVPLLVLALWSFARLRDDARQDGDLLIGQTLRDAAGTAATLAPQPPPPLRRPLLELRHPLHADP